MNTALLWLGGLLVAVLCALFAVPYMIDWNGYRGAFEEEASRLLGRELRVSGPVTVRFLPTPYVSLDKVRLSDLPSSPGYGDGEPLLRAERFTMGLGITPLLRGSIEATEVELTRPELRLQIGADGRLSLPLMPPVATTQGVGAESRFQLRALSVRDGRVVISGHDRRELLTVEDLGGDLAMPAGGPLRFKGLATWGGEPREVRISAAESEPGSVRLRATMQGKTSGASYVFDGQAKGLADRPTLEGELTARLPARIPTIATQPAKGDARPAPVAAATDAFELKSQIQGDANAIALRDLAISFEREGQPQSITGEALVAWRSGLDVRTNLASKWLDLDRIAGSTGGVRPLDAAAWLSRTVLSIVPEGGKFTGRIAVESVNLGGDVINGVLLAVAGGNGRVTIDELRAGLPGGAIFELKGRPGDSRQNLTGDIVLRASSAARLVNWAAKGAGLPQLTADGTLLVAGRVTIDAESAELIATHVEIAGQPLTGTAGFNWSARPKLSLAIDAHRLDIVGLLPGILSRAGLATLAGVERPEAAAKGGPAELARWFDPSTADLLLKIRLGQIDDGQRRFRDVSGDIRLIGRELIVEGLQAATDAGGTITLSARGRPAAGDPTGFAALGLSADSPQGLIDLMALNGVTAAALPSKADLDRLVPMRLASTLTRGKETSGRTELIVDGGMRATRVYVNSHIDGPPAGWATAPIDLYSAFVGPQAGEIGRLILGMPRTDADSATDAPSDGLVIRLAGRADSRFMVNGSLQTAEMDMGFSGTVTPKDGTLSALSGRAQINRATMKQLIALSGSPVRAAAYGSAVSGEALVEFEGGKTTAILSGFRIGASIADATMRIASIDGVTSIDIDARTDQLTLADLLTPVLQPAAPQAADGGAPSPWPDKPFDLDALRRNRMTLKLSAGQLILDAQTVLPAARIAATLKPGLLEISELSGDAARGRISTNWRIEPQTADVTVTGTMKLAGAQLEAFEPAAKGEIGATLTVSGRGSSLRSITQFLAGRGEISLARTVLTGINQTAVATAADRFLAGDIANTEGLDLAALIRTALAGGQLPLRDIRLPVEIANGALKVASFKADSAEATVVNRTTLDLVTLIMDSEWRISPGTRPQPAGKSRGPLPGVSVLYVAPASRIARSEPRVNADELARELSVRRMERAVDELERLRKLDEERARQEAERRKALEEAQARSLEALQPQVPQLPPGLPPLPGATGPNPLIERPPVAPGLPIPVTPAPPGRSGEVGPERRL